MNLSQQLPSRFIKCFKWWGSNKPEDARTKFRDKISPTIDKRRYILREMAHVFMADEIDSVELSHLSDSLDIINSKFQQEQLRHLREMHGKPVSAGVYLYQIQAGGFMETKKMVLLK